MENGTTTKKRIGLNYAKVPSNFADKGKRVSKKRKGMG